MVVDVLAASQTGRLTGLSSYAFLDGVDVTHDCFYADTERGIVRCYKRDTHGHFQSDGHGGHVWEERRGVVQVMSPAQFREMSKENSAAALSSRDSSQ